MAKLSRCDDLRFDVQSILAAGSLTPPQVHYQYKIAATYATDDVRIGV